MKLSRQAAVGVWRRADEFARAGHLVSNAADVLEEPMVAYFLFCHAIELGLKSFLVGRGATDAQLRRLGHDLEAALRCCEAHTTIQLSDEDRGTIAVLNSYYKEKEFEYLVTGSKRFPILGQVQATCASLLGQLEPLAWRAARDAAQ